MKILILGAGQVGRTAAQSLAGEPANEVTVIDNDEKVLRDLQDRIDIRAVAGNAAHPSVLESAGIADTDILIALTNSDEVNIVACQIAQLLYRTPTRIARIRAAEYTSRPQLFAEGGLAVDVWISPEELVTDYIAHLLSNPGALQVVDFADGRVQLAGVRAQPEGLLVGKPLRTLREHLPDSDVRVAAIYRDGRLLEAGGDTVIAEGDEIFFVAARDDLTKMLAEVRKRLPKVRKLVIAGGGHIGLRLARTLEHTHQIKLIERDPRRAHRASEILQSAIVLQGDAADEELMLEENIDSADVFAALTNSDEANIVISPQTITIGSLLAHVRRGDVVRVHSLRRGMAEAIEVVVHGTAERSRVIGRCIEEVELPEGASVVAIARGEAVIMAHHDTLIENEDHLIVFLADRRHVEAVERLFQGER